MKNIKLKNLQKKRRKSRNRAKIFGTPEKPRLSVFRSNRYTSIQLIDDTTGRTLLALSTKNLKKQGKNKSEQANLLGKELAEKSLQLGLKKAVFNKGQYKYLGRIKAIAEGARSKGLIL
ncbi:MAG: 50S ribosomal protein L18 [Candidatus Harrisonbacteria bacterium]|nr:50S ribosomal protein L18 [Candidatus Harrisonbacteria bacterium]